MEEIKEEPAQEFTNVQSSNQQSKVHTFLVLIIMVNKGSMVTDFFALF